MFIQRSTLLRYFIPTFLAGIGLSTIIGCGGGFSGPSGPAEMALSSPVQNLEAGAETQASVEITDFSGRELPKASVTWETSDPDIAQPIPLTPTGQSARILAGQKGGQVTITAKSGDQSATLVLNVTGPKAPEISYARDIQPIYTRTCALPDCHGQPEETAGGDLLLEPENSYANTVGVKAVQVRSRTVLRIEPGQPDNSYLIAKIRGTHRQLGGTGARMPQDGTLPEGDLEKIVKWVQAGSPNN